MNINQIAGNVNRNFLRGNRYRVFLAPPASVSGSYDLKLVGENCCEAQLPGAQFGTFLWRNAGPAIKLPYEMIFDETRMVFYNDGQANASRFLREWNRSIMTKEFRFEYFDQYTADIKVEEYDVAGAKQQSVTFKNAYCSAVEPIVLSYENQNVIEKVGCSFSYEYFEYD